MNTNVVRYNKLSSSQAHTVVRNEGGLKSAGRIADGEHHLSACSRNLSRRDLFNAKSHTSGINMTLRAFRTHNRNFVAVAKYLGGISTTHNAGNTKFARDDRCMRSASSLIGNDRGDTSHYGFPVWVSKFCHQDLSVFNFLQLSRFAHNADTAGANLFADCLASHECGTMLTGEPIGLCRRLCCFRRMNSLRPGLNDEEFASYAIFSPLDVHWLRMSCLRGVMFFDDTGPPCKFENFIVS